MSDDRSWIEAVTGGKVTSFEQATTGRSRATWLVDVDRGPAGILQLVLRRDTGDGPMSGTELSLERESAVYAALSDTAVPTPELLAVADDGLALLVERISGTDDIGGDSPARHELMLRFIEAVAALHAVDTSTLDLPGIGRPESAADHALIDLALWRRIYDEHVKDAHPLFSYAFRWLAANAPTEVGKTALCHGDLGPGNFMHEAGRVTALLDWEFAHLGDPMDDLAWLRIRATHVAGIADIRPLLAHYEALTGTTVSVERIRYYQVMVLTRMAVACLVALGRRSGKMDASIYLLLLPLLKRQLTNALAENSGVVLPAPDVPAPRPPSPRATVLDVVTGDLGSHLMPELQTQAGRSRAMGMTLLLMHLQVADTLGPACDDAELDDLGGLLGERPATVEAGWSMLGDQIAAGTIEDTAALTYFSRHADREVALWPIVAGPAARPLAQIDAR